MEDFFIQNTLNTNQFLHFVSEDKDGNVVYELKDGVIGAAVWKKHTAYAFITSVRRKEGFQNLKSIPVKTALARLNGPEA